MMKRQKAEEREQRPWNRAKRYLLGGLKDEERPGQGPVPVLGQGQGRVQGEGETAVQKTPVQAAAPGQLDVLARNAETAAKETTRGWTSWFR